MHNWIVGSPEAVVEKVEKIYDEVGGFGQLLVFGFDMSRTRRRGAIRSSCCRRR